MAQRLGHGQIAYISKIQDSNERTHRDSWIK
jgi:hypothetical protein